MIVGCMANVVFGVAIRIFTVALSSVLSIALAYACTLVFGFFAYHVIIDLLAKKNPESSPAPEAA